MLASIKELLPVSITRLLPQEIPQILKSIASALAFDALATYRLEQPIGAHLSFRLAESMPSLMLGSREPAVISVEYHDHAYDSILSIDAFHCACLR